MKQHLTRYALGFLLLLILLGHSARLYQIPLIKHFDAIGYDAKLRLTMPKTQDDRIVILRRGHEDIEKLLVLLRLRVGNVRHQTRYRLQREQVNLGLVVLAARPHGGDERRQCGRLMELTDGATEEGAEADRSLFSASRSDFLVQDFDDLGERLRIFAQFFVAVATQFIGEIRRRGEALIVVALEVLNIRSRVAPHVREPVERRPHGDDDPHDRRGDDEQLHDEPGARRLDRR